MKESEIIVQNTRTGVKRGMSCPMRSVDDHCKISGITNCRYGLTEIEVPKDCPLKVELYTETFSVMLEQKDEPNDKDKD